MFHPDDSVDNLGPDNTHPFLQFVSGGEPEPCVFRRTRDGDDGLIAMGAKLPGPTLQSLLRIGEWGKGEKFDLEGG